MLLLSLKKFFQQGQLWPIVLKISDQFRLCLGWGIRVGCGESYALATYDQDFAIKNWQLSDYHGKSSCGFSLNIKTWFKIDTENNIQGPLMHLR